MRAIVFVATGLLWALFSYVLLLTPAHAADPDRQIVVTKDSDYYGFDLLTEKDVTLEQCKSICLANSGCKAFTFNSSAQFCFLKKDFRKLNSFPGAIAGKVVTVDSEPDLGAAPKLSFVSDALVIKADKFRQGIVVSDKLHSRLGVNSLLKVANEHINNENFKIAAEKYLAALAVTPENPKIWLSVAWVASKHKPKGSSRKRFFRNLMVTASLNGYKFSRTKNTRARALSSLARGLNWRGQYRDAMESYKASLKLRELAYVRHNYEALQISKGFRVVEHTVNSESLNPRICIQFSEKLDTKFSGFERFIRVDNKEPQSIDVSARQICIEGLVHGKKYKIRVRSGLPSAFHEALRTDANLNIYINDRSASLRFVGSGFVLPNSGRHGIPIVSVNTQKADIKLYRIGERALAQLLQGSKFLAQLESYELDTISDDLGAPIWNGSLEIKTNLNREVTTSIPINEALPHRKTGVYVMSANVFGESRNRVTQWFVISDIGLTTFSGRSKLQVFTRSLSTAKPLVGVDITLIARNNEVLGTAKTDENGQAEFDAGLTRGKGGQSAALISAKQSDADFVFLDIAKPGFDFSDRGVAGRDVPTGVDVYAWSERGIYRAGETVHIAALARDQRANAIEGLPLTFVFQRPDGEEYRRIVDNGTSLGGYYVELPLTNNAKRGTWKLKVFTDPKSAAVTEQQFLVEDFIPEKTDFTLNAEQQQISLNQDTLVSVEGRYLYGAPAADLSLEGEVVLRTTRERLGHKGYLFGLADGEDGATQRYPLGFIPKLDGKGMGKINVRLENTIATSRPQSADVVVRMMENSGRAVERRTSFAVKPSKIMLGVRPQFDDGQINENSAAEFSIIVVDPDGNKVNLSTVSWRLMKLERNYQWYRSNSSWRYEAIDHEVKVADGALDLLAQDTAKISALVKWGRYRLDVETSDINGPTTSVKFNAGWSVSVKSTDTPDGLEIALDKSNYKAGEVAHLKVSPRFEGELLIAIGTDSIVSTQTVTLKGDGMTIDIPVQKSWGAGAYILATLYRPGEAKKSRSPKRAIGVKWLSINPQNRKLEVVLDAPAKTQPNQPLTIPVSITNLKPGERAYVAVAAVDVGILNLTNHQTPNPLEHYFGQRKFGITMRDIYGRLIDGSLGAVGRLRTGGDGAESGMSTNGSAPTEQLVSFFSGPVLVDENGKATINFSIPQFGGTVRIMATAWSASGVGSADFETIIRDPIVIVANLPKFMAPGDQARLLVELTPTDAPSGRYSIEIDGTENLSLISESVGKTVDLVAGKKMNLVIPVMAKSTGSGSASIRLFNAAGLSIEHEIHMKVRPAQLPVIRKFKVPLAANGGSLLVNKNLIEGSALDGAKINISVARPSTFDVASLLLSLDQYPYGCAEQTTSKALPLLYASDFTGGIPGLDEVSLRGKIQKAIHRVLGYQSNTGGFSLWGTGSDQLWLGAYVTDFLTRANEKGFQVPGKSMERALSSLENTLTYKNDLTENDEAVAYALYVLARNRRASAGDLRYYADSRLTEFLSPIGRAHLAAGLALYGDKKRAETVFSSALYLASNKPLINASYNYGTTLRDTSALLALASESKTDSSLTEAISKLANSIRVKKSYTSTQEQAWMLLAARAEQAANDNISLSVNGLAHGGAYTQRVSGNELADQSVELTNRGSDVLRATITSIAVPSVPLAAGGKGFAIERAYYRLNGEAANVSEVKQNERFVVVIKITQLNNAPSQFILTDLLPAGFEIDNPRLVGSSKMTNFDWLPAIHTTHTEFKDDRFVASFKRSSGGKSSYTVAYMVRAVTPGIYSHPAAQVEDMYRPELSARTAAGWMQVKIP